MAGAPVLPMASAAVSEAVTSQSTLDVEAYASNYTGFTRLKRLWFIGANSTSLKQDALRMALDEVKRTVNTSLYLDLIALAGEAAPRDDAWIEAVDRKAGQVRPPTNHNPNPNPV